MKNVTYKEARVYLDNVSKYGSVLGLGPVRKLLYELGNPQDDLKFIHIAGTNGKGSVLAYTSTILQKAGYRIGRYISPTVVSYLERIQVDAQWISEDAFARLTGMVQKAIARMEAAGETSPTVFEAETAIAFLYFKEMHCDLVVLECGLGGRTDATNIIDNTLLAVFTSVSRDHLGVLGNTIEEIAAVKSGIIKPGCTVVTARQQPEVMKILAEEAQKLDCPLCLADPLKAEILKEDYTGQTFIYDQVIHCSLAGRYQIDNAVTAIEAMYALNTLGYSISMEAIQSGISSAVWPGRLTCLRKDPPFFVDGAHNEDAARRLRESIEAYFPGKRLIYIMGVFRDKEYEKIADILGPLASSIHTVDLPDADRTLPAHELAAVMQRHCMSGASIRSEESISEAVSHALKEADTDDVILAFGSLSYLGRVMELIKYKGYEKYD